MRVQATILIPRSAFSHPSVVTEFTRHASRAEPRSRIFFAISDTFAPFDRRDDQTRDTCYFEYRMMVRARKARTEPRPIKDRASRTCAREISRLKYPLGRADFRCFAHLRGIFEKIEGSVRKRVNDTLRERLRVK